MCEYYRSANGNADLTRKKIDINVFPMLCTIFAFSLLDRTNISAGYIAGMAKDLELAVGYVAAHNMEAWSTDRTLVKSSRYSIALLVFFIGYALFEIPSNMVIRRIGSRKWLPFLIIIWGTAVLAMGFVHSWVPLTVLRVILGIFEAGCRCSRLN